MREKPFTQTDDRETQYREMAVDMLNDHTDTGDGT